MLICKLQVAHVVVLYQVVIKVYQCQILIYQL